MIGDVPSDGFVRFLKGVRLFPGAREWPYAVENSDRIAAHWQERHAQTPQMWDGRMLLAHGLEFRDGHVHGQLMEVNYSAYLFWRENGYGDRSVFNIFGSALVLSADGAAMVGVMGKTTSWPGHQYPPGGSLERGDAGPDGHIDVSACLRRELFEETGLRADGLEEGDLLVAGAGQSVAVVQVFHSPQTAGELLQQVSRWIGKQAEPELEAVRFVRRFSEMENVPSEPWAQKLLQFVLPR
ncbi:MAG TPA: NUDIX hydrolase [Devosia sp.]|nr:NUDIX hydrolase [Devosia sp.]